MKVVIGGTTYTALKNLSFAPQADVTGSEVPINDLTVDIFTDDTIGIGQYLQLKDDLDALWAKYWIVFSEHLDENTVRVKAENGLRLLERDMLDPVMYSAEPVTDVLADIFDSLGSAAYTVDSSFSNATITGFCPEQSAKSRLQWVCFVIGAYIKSFFSDKIEIVPIDTETEILIPLNKTYWKPKVSYGDYVTSVNVKWYSYVQGTPGATDTWVTDGTDYYIETEHSMRLSNPDVPPSVLPHGIYFDGVKIVNNDNVSAILSHLSTYFFKRQEVDIDVINNAEYIPGDRVIVSVDEDTLAVGYIDSCNFEYGIQAKSSMHMTPVEVKESAKLTVLYKYGGIQLGKVQYTLPVGYAFGIDNPYLDISLNRHRFIFRPLTEEATGTMVAGGVTVTVNYEIALDYYAVDGAQILAIASVDDMDDSETGVLEIT